jgi:hypothetical protein
MRTNNGRSSLLLKMTHGLQGSSSRVRATPIVLIKVNLVVSEIMKRPPGQPQTPSTESEMPYAGGIIPTNAWHM